MTIVALTDEYSGGTLYAAMRIYAPNPKRSDMRDLVKSLKALSDETRLRILSLLLERECCVCEVMQALDISQTRASRNLAILYDAGFLRLRREGLWSMYSIDYNKIDRGHLDLVEAVHRGLDGNEVTVQDRKRLRDAVRIGPGCCEPVAGGQDASD